MRRHLQLALKRTALYERLARPARDRRRLRRWRRDGRPLPPPAAYKRELVLDYRERFAARCFVETGTAEGDMVAAVARSFGRVASIELDPGLAERARRRCRRWPHVEILAGDSGRLLAQVLETIDEPALFWLDAHAMAGGARGPRLTPIRAELEAVLGAGGERDVLLVDDARLFRADTAYPELEGVRSRIAAARPRWLVTVEDDVLRGHRVVDRGS